MHVCVYRVHYDQADDGESVRLGGVARGQSEGVHVPQVHAFNVLRAAFQDKELSTETTSFTARGLEVSIRAFSSPHWEVSQPSDSENDSDSESQSQSQSAFFLDRDVVESVFLVSFLFPTRILSWT